jgi:DNA polymerase III subunit gamma/tau
LVFNGIFDNQVAYLCYKVGVMITHYLPLYRRYRPQSFADLVGQEAIATTLGNAIMMGRVAHAYLLCGPRGTGKTSSARIFAKTLNCETGPTITPCQTCASCLSITQGNALDVIEFDAASNNGVDDARELIESCQFSPMGGRYKIYIIDEVHMLSSQAFNALLKTLEEPPPNVVFIFATTEAHKVLATIISRCQRFDFNRITTTQIVERLRFIATQEVIPITDQALMLIARHARGGMRDAVGLLDQVSVLVTRSPDGSPMADAPPLDVAEVRLFIGALPEETLFTLMDTIAHKQTAPLLNQLEQLLAKGVDPPQLLKDLTEHCRNLLLMKALLSDPNYSGGEVLAKTGLLEGLSADLINQLATQSKRFAPEELPQLLDQLASTEATLKHTQQPQLWLEVGLLRLAFREDIHLVKDLAQRVQALEAGLAGGQRPHQALSSPVAIATPPIATSLPQSPPHTLGVAPPPQAVAQTKPLPPTPLPVSVQAPPMAQTVAPTLSLGASNAWADILPKVGITTVRSLLQQHAVLLEAPSEISPNRLVIGVSSEPILKILKLPAKLVHLMQGVKAYYGRELQIELVLTTTQPSAIPAPFPAALPPLPVEAVQVSPSLLSTTVTPSSADDDRPPNGLFDDEPSALAQLALASPHQTEPPDGISRPSKAQNSPSGVTTVADSLNAWEEAKGITLQLLNGKVLD